MVPIVSEFLGVIGVDTMVPSTLGVLLPYLLNVTVGVVLVVSVFRCVVVIAKALSGIRRV